MNEPIFCIECGEEFENGEIGSHGNICCACWQSTQQENDDIKRDE